MSKTSRQRPKQISNEEMKKQWDKIFSPENLNQVWPLPKKTLTLKKVDNANR